MSKRFKLLFFESRRGHTRCSRDWSSDVCSSDLFCGKDPRCKAVLGMDPWMRPVSAEVISGGVRQPAFFMFSEQWAQDVGNRNKNNLLLDQFLPNNSDSRGVIEILGTAHLDFSDLPLLSPIAPLLGLKGPLNGERVIEIVDAYLVD